MIVSLIRLLIIILIVVIIIYSLFWLASTANAEIDSNGNIIKFQEPTELKCLKFNDGRLALVDIVCIGHYETISWFLSKGYHIDAVIDGESTSDDVVYMSR